ncbi:MAG TPA: hypothetical protein VK644_01410 [Chitinophagaceae bacterium]|nr:hypothetical protein [Chitinophagaceae bacterium]
MKPLLLSLFIVMFCGGLHAQQVDSIYFHLYTDSLKKGTHNYINVDGKMSDGTWLPLTEKQVQFSSTACEFSGNELIIPSGYNGESITIKAVLKSRPATWKEITMWIKKKPDPAILPTKEDVMKDRPGRKKH